CLTGKRPFHGKSEYDLMHAVLHNDIPNVRTLRGDVPESLGRTVNRLLARDIRSRSRDAGEVVMELERVLVDLRTPTVNLDVADWVRSLPAIMAQTEVRGGVRKSADAPTEVFTGMHGARGPAKRSTT